MGWTLHGSLQKEEEALEMRRPSQKGRACKWQASSAWEVWELVGQSSAADPAKDSFVDQEARTQEGNPEFISSSTSPYSQNTRKTFFQPL